MQDPEIKTLETQLPKDGVFIEAWNTLKGLLAERMAVKAWFDEEGKYSQTCFAPGVSKLQRSSDMIPYLFALLIVCNDGDQRRLQPLRSMSISLLLLQRLSVEAWKSGHREECQKIRGDRASMLVFFK